MGNRKGGKEEGGEEEAKNNQVSKRSEASLHQDDLPKTQQKITMDLLCSGYMIGSSDNRF